MSVQSLESLETALRRDFELVGYPAGEWVPPRHRGGERVLDVLIIGGGQGGLSVAANLLRQRVTNLLVVDDRAPGQEGIWRRFARMKTLRTAKTVSGPDLGIPSLTFQAWFEAQFGAKAFEALVKIDKNHWQDYLGWVTKVLSIPVRNRTRFVGVEHRDGLLAARLVEGGETRTVFTRKLVLAMGIESSGHWWMPPEIEALPQDLRAHTADEIDFSALAGRHVAVIGAGASAFDNAATALEAGAKVTLLCRRNEIQRVQPYKIIANPGFLGHFGALPDASRWRLANHLLTIREAFPKETWDRTTQHPDFALLTGAGVTGAVAEGGKAILSTSRGDISADFVIAGTGFDVDLGVRPELAGFASQISTWGDIYSPPSDEANPRLARYPYLTDGMAFTPLHPSADWISDIHCFNFGATASFGPSGSSISAMKFAAPRLAEAITRDLFVGDIGFHAETLLSYDTDEFEMTFARDQI